MTDGCMTVKATLENLLELRALLLEIAKAEATLERTPGDIERVQSRLEAARDEIAEARSRAKEAALREREIEAQLRANDTLLLRCEKRKAEAKTQQEIDALDAQIAALREKSANLEDEGLELVNEEDSQRERAAKLEAELPRVEADARAERERLRGRQEDAFRQAEMARAERDNRLATLDDETRELWDSLERRHGASLIVPLANMKACGGCDMAVVMQTVEAVKRMNQLTRCEKCGRVLYDPEQVREP